MRFFGLIAALLASHAFAGEVYGATEQSFAFEFKLGPHRPLIDREFPGVGDAGLDPYYRTFGPSFMLMGEVEVDYQFWRPFNVGSLAIGLAVGYAEKFGAALDALTLKPVTESTGLRIFPIKLLAVYRFDFLAQRFNIPLVPYIKGGLVAEPWWIVKGNQTEIFNGRLALSSRWGVAAVVGLAIQIDFLDPRLARDFDTSAGVNHTYLFAEWSMTEVNNFGQKDENGKPIGLDLSSRNVFFGIAVEF